MGSASHAATSRPPVHDRWRRWLWIILCAIPAWVVLMPALVVVFRAWESSGDAWSRIVEFHLATYLWQTILLVTLVTGFAILFGVPAAWLVSTRDFPGRRALEWLLLLPLAMPGFVAASAYVDLLGRMTPFYILIRENLGLEAFLLLYHARGCFLARSDFGDFAQLLLFSIHLLPF